MAPADAAVSFKPLEEEWGEFLLEDGIQVRMRVSVGYLFRAAPGAVRIRYNTAVLVHWPNASAHNDLFKNKKEKELVKTYSAGQFKMLRPATSTYRYGADELLFVQAEPEEFRLFNEFKDPDEPVMDANIRVGVGGFAAPANKAPPLAPKLKALKK
jgi:hypothetical protein